MNVLIRPGADREAAQDWTRGVKKPQGLRNQRVGPLWMPMDYPLGEDTGRQLKACLAKVPVLNQ